MREGAEWFASMGVEKSGGTKCFSVSGHVNAPGNFEVPLGMPFSDPMAEGPVIQRAHERALERGVRLRGVQPEAQLQAQR